MRIRGRRIIASSYMRNIEIMKTLFLTIVLLVVTTVSYAQFSAVRVNALTLTTGTLNAGVDVAFSDKWSIDGSLSWNPISSDHISLSTIAGTVGVRRWRFEPHVGLFWGLHSTAAKYNIYNNSHQIKGFLLGMGSSVGYSWMLSRRWNFTIEGGLGLFYMNDRKPIIDNANLNDITIRHNRKIILAPSKFEVSFSYLF